MDEIAPPPWHRQDRPDLAEVMAMARETGLSFADEAFTVDGVPDFEAVFPPFEQFVVSPARRGRKPRDGA